MARPILAFIFSLNLGLAPAFVSPVVRAAGTTTTPAAPAKFEHRGFTVDQTAVRDLPNLSALRTAAQEQIDIVLSVGLPKEVITFFQSVPFLLVPADTIKSPTPGLYGNRLVKVSTRLLAAGHKPILLHEYLHAYHDQRLPRGIQNPDIIGFFEKAKALGAYEARSHMMQNRSEFFACSGTTFLFGVTAQEPFKRDKVKTTQPALHAFLQQLFGPETGSFAGSLTTPPAQP